MGAPAGTIAAGEGGGGDGGERDEVDEMGEDDGGKCVVKVGFGVLGLAKGAVCEGGGAELEVEEAGLEVDEAGAEALVGRGECGFRAEGG